MMDKKKVLIVEDDDFLREIYIEILQEAGFDVDQAIDGDEAYQKITKGGWDLVLLDIILPKLDGLDIMKKIKAEGKGKLTKCLVFLTNLDNDEQIKQALELGNGYLIKSQLTPDNLLKEVNVYIEKSESQG